MRGPCLRTASPQSGITHSMLRLRCCAPSPVESAMPIRPVDPQQGTAQDTDHWLDQVVRQLPALPSLLRYYDDFDDATRVIRAPANATAFTVHANGAICHLDFSAYGSNYGTLL